MAENLPDANWTNTDYELIAGENWKKKDEALSWLFDLEQGERVTILRMFCRHCGRFAGHRGVCYCRDDE